LTLRQRAASVMKFARILCAVDFSPDSTEAFRIAGDLARRYRGALLVLHAIEAQPVLAPDALIEINKRAGDALADFIASMRPSADDVAIDAEVTSGAPYEEIVRRARDWEAELVVLGAKGATSLEEVLVGGTAEAVMKEAPCSVLVVRSATKP
jgi:nucleotide-binding universal stress UspA family protein